MRVAADSAAQDFSHTFRAALQRQMTAALQVAELGRAQRALWERFQERWRAISKRDEAALRTALHDRYIEWAVGDIAPYDREAVIGNVLEGPALIHYELVPKSIEVHGDDIGVVHYAFVAAIADAEGPRHVEGRWTEVYRAESGTWFLLSSSGGPRPE
jgi:hypothetical protein